MMIQIINAVMSSQFGCMHPQMKIFVNSVTGLFSTKLNNLEVSYSNLALWFNKLMSHYSVASSYSSHKRNFNLVPVCLNNFSSTEK